MPNVPRASIFRHMTTPEQDDPPEPSVALTAGLALRATGGQ